MDDIEFRMAKWDFTPDIWERAAADPDTWCEAMGTVSMTSKRGIQLDIPFGQLLYSSYPSTRVMQQRPLPEQADRLFGFTQDGKHIVLEEVGVAGSMCHIPGGMHQTLQANLILASRCAFDSGGNITRVDIGLKGLPDWDMRINMHGLAEPEFCEGALQGISIKREKLGTTETPVYENDEFVLLYRHDVILSSETSEEKTLRRCCAFALIPKCSLTLRNICSVAASLANFVTLGLGRYAEVDCIWLNIVDAENPVQLIAPFQTSPCVNTSGTYYPFLGYRDIGDKLGLLLKNWFTAPERLRAGADFTASLIGRTWHLPADTRFQTAAQALEALTKAEFGSTHMSQEQRLTQLCNTHGESFRWVTDQPEKFIRRHIATRNYFTHIGDGEAKRQEKGVFKDRGLLMHTEAVMLLCYSLVWEMLGLDGEIARNSYTHICNRGKRLKQLRENA